MVLTGSLWQIICIGESDLVVGELLERVSKERKSKICPCAIKHDEPFRLFVPAPMENDLDKLEDPRYEWFPFEIYRNWDGYQLTPVIASGGVAGHGAPSAQSAFTGGLETPKSL